MGSFLRDLRYALRMTVKSPGFAAVAVVTLALGIGATVASFTLFEAVQWNWMPYPSVDRIVSLGEAEAKEPSYLRDFSGRDYLALKEQSRSYSELAAYDWSSNGTLLAPSGPQVVSTPAVMASLFSILGARTQLGRVFTAEEEQSARAGVVVLTYEAWRKYFAGDPKVLGTTIRLDGRQRTVIGVLRQGFHFWDAEVFVPLSSDGADFQNPDRFLLDVVGRLAPGVTREQAKAELNGIIAGLQPQEPPDHHGYIGWLSPITGPAQYYERRLYLFMGAAFLVLLIACVNVANLLLALGRTPDRICRAQRIGRRARRPGSAVAYGKPGAGGVRRGAGRHICRLGAARAQRLCRPGERERGAGKRAAHDGLARIGVFHRGCIGDGSAVRRGAGMDGVKD